MFRQGFTCPALLKDRREPYAYGAITRSGRPFQILRLRPTATTGLVRFRSPLLAESRLMSVPPGTEMFQFPGFASWAYGFSPGSPKGRGFPIRTSADQRSLASPRGFSQRATSFIASRRQGIHRTPLSCSGQNKRPATHNNNQPTNQRHSSKTKRRRHRRPPLPPPERRTMDERTTGGRTAPSITQHIQSRFSCERTNRRRLPAKTRQGRRRQRVSQAGKPAKAGGTDTRTHTRLHARRPHPCGPGGDRVRTDDPLLAKQVLSQLSYAPARFQAGQLAGWPAGMGQGGLEPPTPRLSSVCSNQLSYWPALWPALWAALLRPPISAATSASP